MGLEDEVAKRAWEVLKDVVWDDSSLRDCVRTHPTYPNKSPRRPSKCSSALARISEHLRDFTDFGVPYGVGAFAELLPSCI